jgi:hypothetical protein
LADPFSAKPAWTCGGGGGGWFTGAQMSGPFPDHAPADEKVVIRGSGQEEFQGYPVKVDSLESSISDVISERDGFAQRFRMQLMSISGCGSLSGQPLKDRSEIADRSSRL